MVRSGRREGLPFLPSTTATAQVGREVLCGEGKAVRRERPCVICRSSGKSRREVCVPCNSGRLILQAGQILIRRGQGPTRIKVF